MYCTQYLAFFFLINSINKAKGRDVSTCVLSHSCVVHGACKLVHTGHYISQENLLKYDFSARCDVSNYF